ncbi:MAG: hypothetical protein QXK37_02305 [Candidatus Woesearchaeota archaeon]
MKIKNLVVLGRTAPELVNGRLCNTIIGHAEGIGFIRLPVRIDSPGRLWDILCVEARHAAHDTRKESLRITSNWNNLNKKIKIEGILKKENRLVLLRKLASNSIERLKKQNLSIAVVRPRKIVHWIVTNRERRVVQKSLGKDFDIISKKDYEARLEMEYSCSFKCRKRHRQWVVDWGVYEAMRKNPKNPDAMLRDLHLKDPQYEKYFVIGKGRKNNRFVIVSVIRLRTKNSRMSIAEESYQHP